VERWLILIDQSIKAPGGHHYEYAQRILDAAKRQGFRTLLIAHKDYIGQIDHDVRAVFSLTFWDNYRYYYGSGIAGKDGRFAKMASTAWNSARSGWLALKRRAIYSRLGLATAFAPQRDCLQVALN
jgi:hypothetical protein